MAPVLTAEQIEELQRIDSPTISNAVEDLKVRGRFEGYLGPEIRCIYPELPPMVAYAVTATIENVPAGESASVEKLLQFLEVLEAAPKPAVCVFKDVSPNPRRASQWGEVLGTTVKALGAVAVVTDGTVRDIEEVRRLGGLHFFAQGVCVSHGQLRMVHVQTPVEISGCVINPGDLLHGDTNGVVLIPNAVAVKVADAARAIYAREGKMLAEIRKPGVTAAKLREIFR